jgi:hypothetical protein
MKCRVLSIYSAVLLVLAEKVLAGDNKESQLIRRAYLDILGVLPTAEELAWYCEYNTDGYRVAVDWLVKRASADNKTRRLLLSKEYRSRGPEEIKRKDLDRSIFYLSGLEYHEGAFELKQAKSTFIELAKKEADADLDVIDYMCNQLMSRVTGVYEANTLLGVLRKNGWDDTLEAILDLYDVKHK